MVFAHCPTCSSRVALECEAQFNTDVECPECRTTFIAVASATPELREPELDDEEYSPDFDETREWRNRSAPGAQDGNKWLAPASQATGQKLPGKPTATHIGAPRRHFWMGILVGAGATLLAAGAVLLLLSRYPRSPSPPATQATAPAAAGPPARTSEPAHTLEDSLFGFPQSQAAVLRDQADLRFSVWNDAQYLYVQAILWGDDDDQLGKLATGEPTGDRSILLVDADADQKHTPQVDRHYSINPTPQHPGLHYRVVLSANETSPIQSSTKGKGAVSYVAALNGHRVRVDSFLIPLAEIGKQLGEPIRLAYWGLSPNPALSIKSIDYKPRPFSSPLQWPMSQYYAVTFVDRPLSIDISKVPDDRQQNDSSPTRASFPNAARQTAASSRPLRWHVRYYSWPDAGFKQPPRDWQAMIDSTPLAEVDQEGLQHDWGSTAPHASVPVDHFALVATSDFDAGDGGDYALEVASDDGVQVYIDNELVLWRSGTSNRIEKTLTPGRHTLKVEYFEIDGSASLSIQVMRMIAE